MYVSELRRKERQFEVHRRGVADSQRRVNEYQSALKAAKAEALDSALRLQGVPAQLQSVRVEPWCRAGRRRRCSAQAWSLVRATHLSSPRKKGGIRLRTGSTSPLPFLSIQGRIGSWFMVPAPSVAESDTLGGARQGGGGGAARAGGRGGGVRRGPHAGGEDPTAAAAELRRAAPPAGRGVEPAAAAPAGGAPAPPRRKGEAAGAR
eukprot:7414138-Pyramimonas_sp.AAC.1